LFPRSKPLRQAMGSRREARTIMPVVVMTFTSKGSSSTPCPASGSLASADVVYGGPDPDVMVMPRSGVLP
jgi:hypothetical protein